MGNPGVNEFLKKHVKYGGSCMLKQLLSSLCDKKVCLTEYIVDKLLKNRRNAEGFNYTMRLVNEVFDNLAHLEGTIRKTIGPEAQEDIEVPESLMSWLMSCLRIKA